MARKRRGEIVGKEETIESMATNKYGKMKTRVTQSAVILISQCLPSTVFHVSCRVYLLNYSPPV